MICNNCNKEVTDEAYFCPYCGTKLKEYELEVPLEDTTTETVVAAADAAQTEQSAQNAQTDEKTQGEEKPTNDMALIGFVGSFVSPLFGFAFGGVGLARSFKRKGAGKGFSIAAIAIAAASFLLNVTIEACSMIALL